MTDTSYWKHEYIEGVNQSWGKPGRTYCAKCGGGGSVSYRFCPWCGRKITKVEVINIIRDGDMWDDEL